MGKSCVTYLLTYLLFLCVIYFNVVIFLPKATLKWESILSMMYHCQYVVFGKFGYFGCFYCPTIYFHVYPMKPWSDLRLLNIMYRIKINLYI